MYQPRGACNHVGVNDPALTDMIEKQMRTIDKAECKKIIQDIQRYIGEKQCYAIGTVGLVYNPTPRWVKNYFYTNDCGNGVVMTTKVWLDGNPVSHPAKQGVTQDKPTNEYVMGNE